MRQLLREMLRQPHSERGPVGYALSVALMTAVRKVQGR